MGSNSDLNWRYQANSRIERLRAAVFWHFDGKRLLGQMLAKSGFRYLARDAPKAISLPLAFGRGAVLAASVSYPRDEMLTKLPPHTGEPMIMHAAPIQDAIDFARFMVERIIGFMKFAINRKGSVSGPVEIAAITNHEGPKWVQPKHFFPTHLNQPY
jgi:hypothetical protein